MVELTYLSLKKTTFFVRIFDISHCVFTQISIGRVRWMRNFHHVCSGISCFWGSGVRQKYAVWVLVGRGIKFRIQRAPSLDIWVKTQWDMSKIRTKKVVFFNGKYVNSTIMVDLFYWNSIGSWIPTHKILFWHVFL